MQFLCKISIFGQWCRISESCKFSAKKLKSQKYARNLQNSAQISRWWRTSYKVSLFCAQVSVGLTACAPPLFTSTATIAASTTTTSSASCVLKYCFYAMHYVAADKIVFLKFKSDQLPQFSCCCCRFHQLDMLQRKVLMLQDVRNMFQICNCFINQLMWLTTCLVLVQKSCERHPQQLSSVINYVLMSIRLSHGWSVTTPFNRSK